MQPAEYDAMISGEASRSRSSEAPTSRWAGHRRSSQLPPTSRGTSGRHLPDSTKLSRATVLIIVEALATRKFCC